MKLRQRSKRDQALDAVASIAKTWSEWRLGEKVSKTASKATRKAAKKASKGQGSRPDGGKRKPVKIVAAVALVGGIGAAAAKKLTGGKAEPLYTPPGPGPDIAPPSDVAVGDLAPDSASAETASVPSVAEPALTASKDLPPRDPSPIVLEDLADAPPQPESDGEAAEPASDEPLGSEDAATASSAEDDAPSSEPASDPADPVGDAAAEDAGDAGDRST